ncbi:hypothetical protein IAU59_000360 [Kwoniella sp. CBS 9459]
MYVSELTTRFFAFLGSFGGASSRCNPSPGSLTHQAAAGPNTSPRYGEGEGVPGHNGTVADPASRLNVLPIPKYHTTGDGSTPICLASNFSITFDTSIDGRDEQGEVSDDLLRAIERTEQNVRNAGMRYLSVQGGREFFYPYPENEAKEDQVQRVMALTNDGPNGPCQRYLSTLRIRMTTDFTARALFDESTLSVDERLPLERYELDIPLSGEGILSAPSALGVLRGLATFEGLWYRLPPAPVPVRAQAHTTNNRTLTGSRTYRSSETGVRYAPFAPYHIRDQASFGWRGLLLDTSRHYFSVDSILRLLDTMSMVKLNVFQWHITDSNSFPLYLDSHPELAQKGAYSPDEVYTEDDVRYITQYAGERGIDLLLELDTPGHTASIAQSHPDLIGCNERQPWRQYAHQPPAGQLRFAMKGVLDWTRGLFDSVARLSQGRYVSTGGDEINSRCMMEDEPTVKALEHHGWTLDQALDIFTETTHSALRENNKTPVVWQEMVLDHGQMTSIKNDTVVQVWVDSSDTRRVLDNGFRVVHAASDYFYLDCGHGSWIGDPRDGGDHRSWCDPYKTWSNIYSFDPYEGVKPEERHLILGGQVSLWTEQTDETNLESTVWPRAAALAELFWSGASTRSHIGKSSEEASETEVKANPVIALDFESDPMPNQASGGDSGPSESAQTILRRITDIRYRMVDRGVKAAPIQPHWCALRPGESQYIMYGSIGSSLPLSA